MIINLSVFKDLINKYLKLEMASKKKINLGDFDLSTTLGTGTNATDLTSRLIRESEALQEQKDRRILCDEDLEKSRYH